jgi:hypothetical protein
MDKKEEGSEASDDSEQDATLRRCRCCKAIGHTIKNCTMDPNLKTNIDIEEEEKRVLIATKQQRKLNIDASISTTHFIKKAVMVLTDQKT